MDPVYLWMLDNPNQAIKVWYSAKNSETDTPVDMTRDIKTIVKATNTPAVGPYKKCDLTLVTAKELTL